MTYLTMETITTVGTLMASLVEFGATLQTLTLDLTSVLSCSVRQVIWVSLFENSPTRLSWDLHFRQVLPRSLLLLPRSSVSL